MIGTILVGCEAQSTPIAAISTPTDVPQATNIPIPELRYGVAGNLAEYMDNSSDYPNFEVLDSTSPIDDFDLVVAYGTYDGWQQSPHSHHISLAVNPNFPPLDNPTLLDLVPQMIDTQALISAIDISGIQETRVQSPDNIGTVRTSLANAGYPDGVQLVLATDTTFALDEFINLFAIRSIDLRLIDMSDSGFDDNQAHLTLFLWVQDNERDVLASQVGDENIIDLFTIPISYITPDDIAVDFSENGIPIPSQ